MNDDTLSVFRTGLLLPTFKKPKYGVFSSLFIAKAELIAGSVGVALWLKTGLKANRKVCKELCCQICTETARRNLQVK